MGFGFSWKACLVVWMALLLALRVTDEDYNARQPPSSTIYNFTRKHTWEVKNHILSGVTLTPWLEIVRKNAADIDWGTYWLRIVFITMMASINSCVSILESYRHDALIEQQPFPEKVVFILGHPRTGTTMLHNILSKDTERFTFPNTLQVGFPSTFITMEPLKATLSSIIDKTRPMDNMPLTMDMPQEDELALNQLSAGTSPYMPIIMMTKQREYWDFFTFQSENAKQGLQRWQQSLSYFLKKIHYHSKSEKTLVLKSPVHTARVKLLLSMFPNAKFVHIHRNPYTVFQSAANMADKTYWYTYLATPSRAQIQNFIIDQYNLLFKEFQATKALIPPENLYEIKFEDFETDKMSHIQRLYEHFGWKWSNGSSTDNIQKYLATIQSFKKNDHASLSEEMKKFIYAQWRDSFDMYGYSE